MARFANDATPLIAATSTVPSSFAPGFGTTPSPSDTTSFAGSAPLPNWSATFTPGAVTAVATVPACGSADCLTSCVAAPASAVAVKVTGEPARPLTDAVAVCVPTVGPSVCVELAIPFTSVRDVAGFIDPPAEPTAQWTGTPWTGRPTAFLTATESAVASAVPTTPDCPFPALSTMLVAVVTIPVALNVIGLPARPGAVASNVFSPATVASVQLATRATPTASVVALLGARLPSNAPVSVNVTAAPGTALLN